ncbi:MAG TPA: alanyl-tRNA editing protein [Caulobacteraceae bacterium]|jgi:Ser-tRNA(Ala) deacylase AlaX
MTERLYLTSDTLTAEAQVVRVERGERTRVMLDRTVFHPRGGGQPGDQGRLSKDGGGDVSVLDTVQTESGEIEHIVDDARDLAPGDRVRLSVDAERRRLNARMHSAGHLIAYAGETVDPSLKGVRGHHWPGEARVDFDGEPADPEAFARALEKTLAEFVAGNLAFEAVPGADGRRTITIGGSAATGCGGTHVAAAGDIGRIVLRKVKAKGGALRVSYDLADA